MWWQFLILSVLSYLLGGVNFAKIISAVNKKDITKMGSGNPGTMNMIRNMGAKWGALTFVLDVLKGAIPSFLGNLWLGEVGLFAGGLSSVIGHVYPVWYGFKGGKGVASAMGIFFVASPVVSLITFGAQLIFILIFKYGSVGNLLFLTVLTVEQGIKFGETTANAPIIFMLFSIWITVWFGHRRNIVNVIVGKEHKSDLVSALKKIRTDKNEKVQI